MIVCRYLKVIILFSFFVLPFFLEKVQNKKTKSGSKRLIY